MTAKEVYNWMGSLPSGGYLTIESRLSFDFTMQTFNKGRAVVLTDRWIKDRSIPREYYQTITPTFNRLAQEDSCYVSYFGLPQFVALDGLSTGIGYVGTVNGVPLTFREVGTRAEFASMQKDRTMKVGRNKVYVLPDGHGGLEIYSGSAVTSFRMDVVAANPLDVITFNPDKDPYPVAEDDYGKIAQYLTTGSLSLPYRTAYDLVNIGKDSSIPNLPRQ
jgi:hypothetical protein